MLRSIPPPPRSLVIGLAMITVFCFLGGAVVNHLNKGNAKGTGLRAVHQPSRSNVTELRLFVPDEEGAMHLKEEYEGKGYHVTVRPIQSKVQVTTGYAVEERLDPVAARPAADALSQVYHLPVSLKTETDKKTLVRVGSVYGKKEDAEKLVQHLKQIGYVWHIDPIFVEKTRNQFELTFSQVSIVDALAMKESFSKNGFKVKLIQTP